MKRITSSAFGIFSILSSACSSQPSETGAAVHIAWISKGRCNNFFDISRFGARLATKDLASRSEGTAELELLEPDDCPGSEPPVSKVPAQCSTAALQMAKVEEAIEKKVDAIAISVINPDCVGPLLDRAADAGIKVLTFDSDAPNSKRHVYYGMDNRAGARLAASTLAGLIGERGQIAIQTAMSKDADGVYHLSASSSYVERMAGIEEELARFPEITLVATVPCIGNEVTDPACGRELEALLATNPDLSGLVLSRGKALRELELGANAPVLTEAVQTGRIHAVAFDAPEDALDNIRAGYANVVIAQKQFGWGYDVVTLAFDMVAAGAQPARFNDSGWYVVCQNNIEQYTTMWRDQDFRGSLADCQFSE